MGSKIKSGRLYNSGFSDWKPNRLPDLSGQNFVVTGGNSGIGLEAARYIGKAGADVYIACRNPQKGEAAVKDLLESAKGNVELIEMDLADMGSIRKAAESLRGKINEIHGLINNAGIMQTPPMKTNDGFELQLGTNHLGHFLWTGLLIDLVEAAKGRVAVVSSVAHRFGKINFSDLMSEKKYDASTVYCQSKLANLLFALELERRLKAKGSEAQCIACHPGYSATNLQSTGPTGLFKPVYKVLNKVVAQPMKNGAIPTVLAAAGTEAQRGAYYGPQGIMEGRGRVSDAIVASAARDEAVAKKLWQVSEELVDLKWM